VHLEKLADESFRVFDRFDVREFRRHLRESTNAVLPSQNRAKLSNSNQVLKAIR
jgi:hypothetical protein